MDETDGANGVNVKRGAWRRVDVGVLCNTLILAKLLKFESIFK